MTYLLDSLDSSVLIDVLNKQRDREALLESLLKRNDLLACCPINVTEVYAGLRPQDRAKAEKLFDNLEYYDVSREAAVLAGALKRDWASRGVTLSLADVTIAAVAIGNNLTLITDNRKDFPMPEIQLYPFPYVQ